MSYFKSFIKDNFQRLVFGTMAPPLGVAPLCTGRHTVHTHAVPKYGVLHTPYLRPWLMVVSGKKNIYK